MPGEHGSVLAVLSGVAYLRMASGEILWVAANGAPMHRRCLKIEAELPRIHAGAPFRVEAHGLNIAHGIILDRAAASPWQSPRLPYGKIMDAAEIPDTLRTLASALDLAQAKGLGRLIPAILGAPTEPVAEATDPVLLRARPAALGIAEAVRAGDRERTTQYADALVGLGAGLTPSGDDFLGGFLFGVNAVRRAYPAARVMGYELHVHLYRSRTHPISLAILGDCSQGHAIAPLHEIVNSILLGASARSLRSPISQLLNLGHSTGWDMLAGLVAGLLTADCNGGQACYIAKVCK